MTEKQGRPNSPQTLKHSKTEKIQRVHSQIHRSSFLHQHIEKIDDFYYHVPFYTDEREKERDRERIPHSLSDADLSMASKKNEKAEFLTLDIEKEPNVRLIFWECKIKRISEIDTAQETFRCRFHYYLTWLATHEETKEYEKYVNDHKRTMEPLAWKPPWVPGIEFTNVVFVTLHAAHEAQYEIKDAVNNKALRNSWDEKDLNYTDLLGFDPNYGKWVRCRYEADMTFAEELELENFPFDCQDFTIYFKAELQTSLVRLIPFPRNRVFCSLDPQFSVLSEWDLQKVLVEFKQTEKSRSRGERTYSVIAIHIKASRKWYTRVGDILITFCMFTMGLGSFAMGLTDEEIGNRLQFAVTLMLADVASLQLLVQQLPNIPYWSEMDFYMYSCFFYLFLITCWSSIAVVFGDEADWYARIFFLVLWFLTNLMFGVRGYIVYHQERAALDYTEAQLRTFYQNRRSVNDRTTILCRFDVENVEQQIHDDNLLFNGEKPTERRGVVREWGNPDNMLLFI